MVNRYPLRVSDSRRYVWEQATGEQATWLIPSFLDLSADYDGVHLSTRGYLESAGRACGSTRCGPPYWPDGHPIRPTG